MPRSIHDNHVLGYAVDHAERTIVIRTEKRDGVDAPERTDLRFHGVIGYHLRDCLGGILDGVHATSLDAIMRDESWGVLFAQWKNQAWPFLDCRGDPVAFVEDAGAKVFEVCSAVGFDGFVVCGSYDIVAVDGRE